MEKLYFIGKYLFISWTQPPQQVATSQPILAYNPGGLQLPPGIAASPELFKQLLAQMQMQAAATAAIAAAGRQNKPRPIAPASSVAKVTSAAGGGAPGTCDNMSELCFMD